MSTINQNEIDPNFDNLDNRKYFHSKIVIVLLFLICLLPN